MAGAIDLAMVLNKSGLAANCLICSSSDGVSAILLDRPDPSESISIPTTLKYGTRIPALILPCRSHNNNNLL